MISAAILVKNEEDNLKKLLPSLSFCDEILIIDNASTDQTQWVAQQFNARIISTKESSFAKRRNRAMEDAKNEWILFLDADERLSEELIQEINEKVALNSQTTYLFPRVDVFWGKEVKFGEVLKSRRKGVVRLVRKDSGTWKGDVHEEFESKYPLHTCKSPLKHYTHSGIADFLYSINDFSTLRAKELHDTHARVSALQIMLYPIGKFLYTYIILCGFLDGPQGFAYSFMMSFHSFLVRSKLYLLNA